MRKELEGHIRIGNVTDSYGEGYVSVEIEDEASGIQFLQIKLDHATFGKLIAGNGSHKVKLEVVGIESIGKTREVTQASIHVDTPLFDSIVKGKWDEREEKIADWIDAHHSVDGWINSRYYGSRNSIISNYATGKTEINFARIRWVDAE